MADGYKEFDDAQWKIGGANGTAGGGGGRYTDKTLNKANGPATIGPKATESDTIGALPPPKAYHSVPGNTSMLPKSAPCTPDPFGQASDASSRHMVAGSSSGGGGGRGCLARHRRRIIVVALVALILAVALGVGLGVGLSKSSSSPSPAAPSPAPAVSPAAATNGSPSSAFGLATGVAGADSSGNGTERTSQVSAKG